MKSNCIFADNKLEDCYSLIKHLYYKLNNKVKRHGNKKKRPKGKKTSKNLQSTAFLRRYRFGFQHYFLESNFPLCDF